MITPRLKTHALYLMMGFMVGLQPNYAQGKHPYASDQPMPIPKKFEIPGIRSAWHITFTPDGNTFYFVTGDSMEVIYSSHFQDGKWSVPKETEFSGKYRIETPSISPDGKKFFFAKAIVENGQGTDDIYVMNKTESGWSEPTSIGSPVNGPRFDAGPSSSANGNLYFFSTRDGRLQLYCSKFIDGKYSNPEALDYNINKYTPLEPFVARDESFILFGLQQGNNNNLHVSFFENGSWTKPKNLGPKINFNEYQGRPCISPDGNYLFYTSGSSRDWIMSQYQVDIKPLLDSLRNDLEISAIVGKKQNLEQQTFIKLKGKTGNVKFLETPSWLKPFVKNIGADRIVTNTINTKGLKEGVYKAQVKLIAKGTDRKEYKYSVTLKLFEPRPAVQAKNLQKGLKYEYYEDTSFTKIPDFTKMKPLKAGVANQIDLSVKNRDTLYAIVYSGYINISQTALYSFSMTSDDGSKLYIDDKLFIDNDGLHGPVEKTETSCLEKGMHKLRVEYIQSKLGANLELTYEAMAIGMKAKIIPSDVLFHE